MGRRGPKPSELKLRLIWNLLAAGWKTTRAIEFSGLARRTAYDYINALVAEGALRRIGRSPALFEPTPAGAAAYKSEVGQNSARPGNSAQVQENSAQPPCGGGRDTASQAKATGTPSTPSQNDGSVNKAKPEAKAGPEPDEEQEPGQPGKAGQEGQDGATAGPRATPEPQAGPAGQAGHGAGDGPHEEDVRPAPPVPLDQPVRVHHRLVPFRILKASDRRPRLDMLQWGPWKPDSHGLPWWRIAEVLFDDIGIVTLMESKHQMRLWLPVRPVMDRRALEEALTSETDTEAQRVANWLQRHYGYQFGLPEPDRLDAATPLPDVGGSFKGWLKIRTDDGAVVTIDQSKGYAELELLYRHATASKDLQKILNWGNAPTLLTRQAEQLMELRARVDALQDALGRISEALAGVPAALDKLKGLEAYIDKAVERAMTYAPAPGPGDNTGYG
jgi:hypothetical protein